MILSFHPCFDADVQIILADRALDASHVKAIKQAKAIILPQAASPHLYKMCVGSRALVFPDYRARVDYPGKMGQHRLFETHHLPAPPTLSWPRVALFEAACPSLDDVPHPIPFLIKQDRRHEGEGVFLIESQTGLSEALDRLRMEERSGVGGFVSQAYVPCQGTALRAVIMGGQINTYWKRPKGETVVTTISRGARIDHTWRPELQQKAETQARILSRKTGINVAAVDFVFPLDAQDPDPLFLEINYYFGRRGLGGSRTYYGLMHAAVRDWLDASGLNPDSVRLM